MFRSLHNLALQIADISKQAVSKQSLLSRTQSACANGTVMMISVWRSYAIAV